MNNVPAQNMLQEDSNPSTDVPRIHRGSCEVCAHQEDCSVSALNSSTLVEIVGS